MDISASPPPSTSVTDEWQRHNGAVALADSRRAEAPMALPDGASAIAPLTTADAARGARPTASTSGAMSRTRKLADHPAGFGGAGRHSAGAIHRSAHSGRLTGNVLSHVARVTCDNGARFGVASSMRPSATP